MRAKGGIGGDEPPRNAVVARVTTDRRSNGVSAREAIVKELLFLRTMHTIEERRFLFTKNEYWGPRM